MKLKMSLLDALHSKEELAESLAEKEQQLEHQDKTSRAQAKVIKVIFIIDTYYINLPLK